LQPKSQHGIFIGYSKGSIGYRFYDPENKKLVESRKAVFLYQDTTRRVRRTRVELLVPEPVNTESEIHDQEQQNAEPEKDNSSTSDYLTHT
jgi:hypothetical protein